MDTSANTDKESAKHDVCELCGKVKRSSSKNSIARFISSISACNCIKVSRVQSPDQAKGGKRKHSEPGTPGSYEPVIPEIDQYEILNFIGEGGMGSVYKVRDENIDSILAVKVLKQELVPDHIAVKRFEQEAIAASKLTHPNLVAVYGHGRTRDGSPFLVMEYLDGESLGGYIDRVGPLDLNTTLDIFIQVCGALAHAHSKGVIHRDLTPGNIILTNTDTGSLIARVVDFGIAKIQHDMRSTQDLTETGSVLGSPAYMSPEQCLGVNLDARADIYSLGCVIFETLTGKELFDGENPVQVIAKHLEELPDIVYGSAQINSAMADIISTCLQRDPNSRYQSVVELGIDLQRVLEGKDPEFCLLSEGRFEKLSKTKPVIYMTLGLSAMVCLSVVVSFFPQVEFFSLFRICLTIVSVLFLGFSISRVSKIFLSCFLRRVGLTELLNLSYYISLLATCGISLVYCVSSFAGFPVRIIVAGGLFLNFVALTVIFGSSSYIWSKLPALHFELLKGVFNSRVSRLIATVIPTGLLLAGGSFMTSQLQSYFVGRYDPFALERNWENQQEIAYLSKLIDFNLKRSFNHDNKIADQYRYIRALLSFRAGNIDDSLDDLNIVIQNNGLSKDAALIERSVIWWCRGRGDQAYEDAKGVLARDPKSREALFLNGAMALSNREGNRAVELFTVARKQRVTTTLLALTNFGLRLEGKEKEARKLLGDFQKYHSDDRLTNYLAGRINYAEMIYSLDEDSQCNMNCLVGWDAMLKGDKALAKKLFERVVEYVDNKGLSWRYGVFYAMAKAELEHLD